MKRFIIFLTIITFSFPQFTFSQIKFDKAFDLGISNQALSVALTNSGNYIFAGTVNVNNTYDGLITLIDTEGNTVWSKSYDAAGTKEHFRKIIQTSDNNFILTGSTNSSSNTIYGDLLVCKINSEGSVIWARKFGESYGDEATDVIETSDSCYLVVGTTNKYFLYASDIFVTKLSKDGAVLWQKILVSAKADDARSVIESNDGGYVVTGWSQTLSDSVNYRVLLFKLDKDGQFLWQKLFKSENVDLWSFQVKEKSDGNLFLAGHYREQSLLKTFLLKTNESGDFLWAKAIEISEGMQGISFDFTTDEGFIISGYNYYNRFRKAFLTKLNSDIQHEWTKIYHGNDQSDFSSVKELPDNGFIATGSLQRPVGVELYLVKTDDNGYTDCSVGEITATVSALNLESIPSQLTFFEPLVTQKINITEAPVTLITNNTCDITVPVELNYFNHLIENNSVKLQWETITERNNFGFEIYRNGVLVGSVEGNGTTTKTHNYTFVDKPLSGGRLVYKLVQTDYDGTAKKLAEISVEYSVSPLQFKLEQNYPNPFNPGTLISYSIPENNFVSLKVYDVLGKEIAALVNEQQNIGTHSIIFDGSSLASGIYYYILKTDKFTSSKKMILLK